MIPHHNSIEARLDAQAAFRTAERRDWQDRHGEIVTSEDIEAFRERLERNRRELGAVGKGAR